MQNPEEDDGQVSNKKVDTIGVDNTFVIYKKHIWWVQELGKVVLVENRTFTGRGYGIRGFMSYFYFEFTFPTLFFFRTKLF